MSLQILNAEAVLQQLHTFDTVIDARSEDEYAEDHLPMAVNWPTLNNEERKTIGTLYKQVNPFEAKKRGAAIAAHNIAQHINREVIDKPRGWKPLTYCWRGGKRSGSLSLILDQIGFRVTLVEGGYKAFRAAMLVDLPQRVAPLKLRVVCGTTGSGKTRLLHALKASGAQVLDLEDLACHRSSVLGALPGQPQPTQKRFDSLVWNALRQFDPSSPIFVESESKKVGNVAIPTVLVEHMRQSPCIQVDLPLEHRVALLLEDYDHLVNDPAYFCNRLDVLAEFQGKAVVAAWKDRVMTGNLSPVVQDLLLQHYDPVYLQSMQRNFVLYGQATVVAPASHRMEDMLAVASVLTCASGSLTS
jgi:tRNA 2-selenouridine synthase